MNYWSVLLKSIQRHNSFAKNETEQQKAYLSYWLDVLERKPLPDDEYQLAMLHLQLQVSGDEDAWVANLMALHNKGGGDHQRTLRFMKTLKEHPAQVRELYRQIACASTQRQSGSRRITFSVQRCRGWGPWSDVGYADFLG